MTASSHSDLALGLGFLKEKLPSSPPDRFQFLTVPAPAADLESLWEADPLASAVLWDSPLSGGWSGLGEVAVVAPRGTGRFSQAGHRLCTASEHHHEVAPWLFQPKPSWFGGFAFASGSADHSPWDVFGEARFVLPRWIYHRPATGGASLTLCLGPGVPPPPFEPLRHEFEPLWRSLAHPTISTPLPEVESVVPIPWVTWNAAVDDSLAAMAQGTLRKVVLAGASPVTFSRPPSPSALLRQLAGEGPDVFRFGFRWHGRVFAGASPELLIARHQNLITSEALAGSAAAGTDPGGLLHDAKQREEHQAVVDSIRSRLAPVCDRLESSQAPVVRQFRHVMHLSTRFSGTLVREENLAGLAGRLHPTPAVGGVPEEAALKWIQQHEEQPRGWYASPVGRIEAGGEGELAVALRCTILRGRRALVYAGAGLVPGSVPEMEYEELRIKTRACLHALGIDA